jgi:dipeptidyl aminopeptidase/acylaminoacyl peptidase
MAARAWTVLALNPIGSGSYGADFAAGIRGGWGERDLPEHLAAVDALIADGAADPNRLAITGYSYGGYMTCWALTHTDRFKVGVAGGAVTNLESFYGTSDIGPWFAPYEIGESRDGLRRHSPIRYVDRVRAPLLLLHGEEDQRCPIGQSEEFFTALAALRIVPCELVRYPGASHLLPYRGRPRFRVDYARRLMEWVTRFVCS